LKVELACANAPILDLTRRVENPVYSDRRRDCTRACIVMVHSGSGSQPWEMDGYDPDPVMGDHTSWCGSPSRITIGSEPVLTLVVFFLRCCNSLHSSSSGPRNGSHVALTSYKLKASFWPFKCSSSYTGQPYGTCNAFSSQSSGLSLMSLTRMWESVA